RRPRGAHFCWYYQIGVPYRRAIPPHPDPLPEEKEKQRHAREMQRWHNARHAFHRGLVILPRSSILAVILEGRRIASFPHAREGGGKSEHQRARCRVTW